MRKNFLNKKATPKKMHMHKIDKNSYTLDFVCRSKSGGTKLQESVWEKKGEPLIERVEVDKCLLLFGVELMKLKIQIRALVKHCM